MFKITKPRDKLYCDHCKKLVNYGSIEREEVYEVKGLKISISSTIAVCKECGKELFEPYYENENLKRAYIKYAKITASTQ